MMFDFSRGYGFGAIATSGLVSLIDYTNPNATQIAVGDSYGVQIMGATPFAQVTYYRVPQGYRGSNKPTSVEGATDWQGNFTGFKRTPDSTNIGAWTEQWFVGGKPVATFNYSIVPAAAVSMPVVVPAPTFSPDASGDSGMVSIQSTPVVTSWGNPVAPTPPTPIPIMVSTPPVVVGQYSSSPTEGILPAPVPLPTIPASITQPVLTTGVPASTVATVPGGSAQAGTIVTSSPSPAPLTAVAPAAAPVSPTTPASTWISGSTGGIPNELLIGAGAFLLLMIVIKK